MRACFSEPLAPIDLAVSMFATQTLAADIRARVPSRDAIAGRGSLPATVTDRDVAKARKFAKALSMQ